MVPQPPPDDYRPRPDDHRVEPLFGGLGAGEPARVEPEPRRGLFARLLRRLARLRGGRPSRPGSDR